MVFLFIKAGLGRALGIEKPRHRWIATRTGFGALKLNEAPKNFRAQNM